MLNYNFNNLSFFKGARHVYNAHSSHAVKKKYFFPTKHARQGRLSVHLGGFVEEEIRILLCQLIQ